MENIFIIINPKENYIFMIDLNLKENFYLIKNGMEKDMMKIVK